MTEIALSPETVFPRQQSFPDSDAALGQIEAQPQPLTPEQVALVEEHAHLPAMILSEARYKGLTMSRIADDALGNMQIELCTVARRYDPEKGASFQSFAIHRLRGALIDTIREDSRLNGRSRSEVQKYKTAVDLYEKQNGEANEPDFTLVIIDSLDATLPNTDDFGYHHILSDTNPGPETLYEQDDSVRYITELIESLPDRTAEVMKQYLAGMPMDEIGYDLGVTESRICQIVAKARITLREELGIRDASYTDEGLAGSILDTLLSKKGKMIMLSGNDVVKRLVTRTDAPHEQIHRAIGILVDRGYALAEYMTANSPNSMRIGSLALTSLGLAYESTKDTAEVDAGDQTADDVIAMLKQRLSVA